MTAPDDLSALDKKPFAEARVKFEELLAHSGRAFLIGAGCSKCAGLPLTAELTKEALSSDALDDTTKRVLAARAPRTRRHARRVERLMRASGELLDRTHLDGPAPTQERQSPVLRP